MTRFAALSMLVVLGSAPALAGKKPACIRDSGAPVVAASLDGNKVKLCVQNVTDADCFTAKLDDGALATAGSLHGRDDGTFPDLTPRAHASVDGSKVTVTRPGAKARHFATHLVGEDTLPLGASTNADGSLTAVWTNTRGKHAIETFDTAGKRVASFDVANESEPCLAIDIAGDTLVLQEGNCTGLDTTAWLADRAGKKLGVVGGKQAMANPSPDPVHVKDSTWAFSSVESVVLHDVQTGAVVKTIELGSKAEGLMVGDDKRLVILAPGSGVELVAIDLATDKVTRKKLATCR